MKTFIVHVSVDAESVKRAEELVGDCIQIGSSHEPRSPEGKIFREHEVAVVLSGTDEVEYARRDRE